MIPTITLHNKRKMPMVGLGTWQADPGVVGEAVRIAISDYGYKHIDCAAAYNNEAEIGRAFTKLFKAKTVKREDLFITSKLWNTQHDPKRVIKACKQTLSDLNLEYLDLYLMHWGLAFSPNTSWPVKKGEIIKTIPVGIFQTWEAMEKLIDAGLVKSIGVANFTAPMIQDLLSYARVKPAMNQIELHPYNSQPELVEFCQKKNVVLTAYSPLGSPGNAGLGGPQLLEDPVVISIAKAHQKSAAQVLIRWSIERNIVVIPKSTTPKRIAENLDVFDFKLTQKEMNQLSGLNRDHRYVDPSSVWGIPYFK
jgi:diketogulonate reductase-like aldo/keto reductase